MRIIFYLTIALILSLIFLNFPEQNNIFPHDKQIDEAVYQDTIEKWNSQGIAGIKDAYNGSENKPLSFLYVQKLLDANPLKTRLLNAILVILNTYLIFRYTGSYRAFLYPIIPIFLNSMWLTVEIIETFFIILAISIKQYEGFFVGLAMIFRPYALLYTAVIERRQIKYVLLFGLLFTGILAYNGLLWVYVTKLFLYGSQPKVITDYVAFLIFIPMLYLGSQNKQLFKYGIVASIPLVIRAFGHYFIPSYSLFFIASIKK